MADLYPNIHFPKVDSSGLAELPDIYREGQERSALKASLADLDSSDPKSLRAAANRAIGLGTKDGIETGIRLHTIAQARENLAQTATRDAQNSAYIGMLPGFSGLFGGAKAAPGPTEGNPAPFVGGSTPPPQAAPPVAPPTMWNNPTVIGPRSEVQPSPSDEMITAAQRGGGEPPVAGSQLAGPLPTPDSPPPTKSGLPSWVGGAQAPAVTVAPPQALAPQQPLPPVPGESSRRTELERAMMSLPPKATAQRAAIAEALKAETTKDTTLSAEYKNFYMDQVDRAARAQPTQTIADWRNEIKVAPELTKQTNDIYEKDYRERDRKSIELGGDLAAMATIMKNPKFAPGAPGLIDEATSLVASLNDKLKSIGVDPSLLLSPDTIKGITEPTALRETFAAVANRAVISALGGLGRQISDSDRNYMEKAFGSLLLTKQGTELTHKFLGEVAERQATQAQAAREYLKGNNRATPGELDQAVNDAVTKKYGSKGLLSYDNGNPTQLRLQIDKAISGGSSNFQAGETIYDKSGRAYKVSPDGRPIPVTGNGNSL